MTPHFIRRAAALFAAAVFALAPALALAASTARIEWVQLSSRSNDVGNLLGEQRIAASSAAVSTSAAPTFPGGAGFARVTVVSGAVVVWPNVTVTDATGVRIAQGDRPLLVPVNTGDTLSVIEASDLPAGGGGGGGPYTLLSNASASGSPVVGIVGGSYVWSCTGTFAGATLTLQTLGPNGSTFVTVATMTSASNTGVVIGTNATAKVTVSAGPPSAMYCTLS